MMLELLTHLCSLAPSYGTASRTCSDCYKEHDMHHSKPIEDIESLTAKQILCQRKSKALTTIFGGNLSKAAPQLVGGNTKAICSSCQGTLGRLYSISGRGKKAAPISSSEAIRSSQIWTACAYFFPCLHCTSALSVAFRKCGSLEVATHKLRVCTRRRHLEHTKLKIIKMQCHTSHIQYESYRHIIVTTAASCNSVCFSKCLHVDLKIVQNFDLPSKQQWNWIDMENTRVLNPASWREKNRGMGGPK